MKFTTIVIIKADPAVLDNIRQKLSEKSKAYPSEDLIKSVSLLPDVNMSDNKDVARALSELTGTETGVDEHGVYILDTVFKDTLIDQCRKKIDKQLKDLKFFDYYDIFDLRMTDDLLDNVDEYDRFPDSIITPDFELIRTSKAFMNVDETSADYKDFIDWKKNFKEKLKTYSGNSFSLILDCHV